MDMEYRRLGRSGLKVSVLSFGSWVTFGPQIDVGLAVDCIGAAGEAGVNFFDNAEAYAGGESERSWARPSNGSAGSATTTSCRPRSSGV